MANYTQVDDLTNKIFKKGDTISLSFTGVSKEIKLLPGTYKIECWGASGEGANPTANVGSRRGRGGYTTGLLNLIKMQTLFGYVGEHGKIRQEGWNGGGNNSYASLNTCGGGGASDIRLENGTWDSTTGLRSRIMVAGGGGSSDDWDGAGLIQNGTGSGGTFGGSNDGSGGDGGGLTGGQYRQDGALSGSAATQTSGYAFGKGAPVTTNTDTGAAGGGYYGGYASNHNNGGGSGGSSFISGLTGCNAIRQDGTHTGQPIHYSGLLFTECNTIAGVNDGNGKILITCIDTGYYYVSEKDFNIDSVTLNDFMEYGHSYQEISSNDLESFLFAAQTIDIPMKVVPHNQIIINSNFVDISYIHSIWQIKITGQTPTTSSLKFLINNRQGWFTYKNSQWYQLSSELSKNSIPIGLIESSGMTMLEISLIQPEEWVKLFPDVEKFISFMTLMTMEEFDITPIISNILVTYDSSIYGKKKIHDTLYSVKKKVIEYQITWNTANKRKIEIIIKNRKKE